MKSFLIELKILFAKNQFRALKSFVLSFCLVLVISLAGLSFVSLADVYDLMVGTDSNARMIRSDSNALMTLDLDDSDYSIMPMSSLGSVVNTVDYSSMFMFVDWMYEDSGGYAHRTLVKPDANGDFYITRSLNNTKLMQAGFTLNPEALPRAGGYYFSFDLASDFSYSIHNWYWYLSRNYKNSNSEVSHFTLPVSVSSGDSYLSPTTINLPNLDEFNVFFTSADNIYNFGGRISINFTRYSGSVFDHDLSGFSSSSSDYQEDVSGSLSDLSSSVDSMTEDLSSAAESLEYISTSQNLIIQGIDNVVMHISDQLFAFWNQLYNLIHVPTMAKMDDIIDAINNMDLEIEVNLDGLKTTINNMSTAVQNKLQSTTDQITGGYDNSGITQENEKLEQSINQYDEVESGIFEDAEGFIGDFEYPSVDSLPLGIIKALAFVGSFLQGVFLSMGEFSVIITFSLTMIFVMVVVGYHRIRS